MENPAQDTSRRAIQRWEGEGGAISEGPQQAQSAKRSRGTASPKRTGHVAKGDDDNSARRSRHTN